MNIRTEQRTEVDQTAGILIRQATGEDLEKVVALATLVFRATYTPIAGEDYVEMGLAKWWTPSAVIDHILAGRLVVAELEGQVVGVANWGRQKDRAILWGVYVLPDVQRMGVGGRLLREICATVEEAGWEDLYFSYVLGNENTRRWLERRGFVEQWRDEGNDLVPTQVWTRKMLNPSAGSAVAD